MSIERVLSRYAQRCNHLLAAQFSEKNALYPILQEAMRYSLLSGGKRIRPALVYLACEFCSGSLDVADIPATAIELLHTYSLIHDDLPAMDDDALRRGQSTCHIAYGEANAILAGDALLTAAFEVISTPHTELSTAQQLSMVQVLAEAAGHKGMVLGQAFDLAMQTQTITLDQLQHMHRLKTGALIQAALKLGALCSPEASPSLLQDLDRFGALIGLAFQIQDDILDEEGNALELGKNPGVDKDHNKATFPALLGLEASKGVLHSILSEAETLLLPYGDHAKPLIELAHFLAYRRH